MYFAFYWRGAVGSKKHSHLSQHAISHGIFWGFFLKNVLSIFLKGCAFEPQVKRRLWLFLACLYHSGRQNLNWSCRFSWVSWDSQLTIWKGSLFARMRLVTVYVQYCSATAPLVLFVHYKVSNASFIFLRRNGVLVLEGDSLVGAFFEKRVDYSHGFSSVFFPIHLKWSK